MTRPIDAKGKTSAKRAHPEKKEEVTSNSLSRAISRDAGRARIVPLLGALMAS